MSPPPSSLQRHNPALDGIRGLAILGVMICHFFQMMDPKGGMSWAVFHLAGYGVQGVDLFFLLSGYLITRILLATRDDEHYFKNFFVRRALRIMPLYYGTLVVVLLVLPRLSDACHRELALTLPYQAWAWLYAVNFFRFFHPDHDLPYLGHFWTLAIEEHFYLFWPFVVRFVPPTRLRRWLPFVIAAVWILVAGAALLPFSPDRFVLATTPLRVDMPAWGALLALWSSEGRPRSSLVRFAQSVAASAVVATLVAVLAERHAGIGPGALAVFSGVRMVARRALVLALFSWLIASPADAWPHKVVVTGALRFFGKYSYGLYVFHSMIGLAAYRHGLVSTLSRVLHAQMAGVTASALLCGALSVLLAVLSYRFFESPFLALKARFTPDLRASSR